MKRYRFYIPMLKKVHMSFGLTRRDAWFQASKTLKISDLTYYQLMSIEQIG
jgi:hypothetical protein